MNIISYIFDKIYGLFDKEVSTYQTVYHLYGFSEPASERMHSLVEMFHNTAVCLSYIFVVILLIIGLMIYFFKADNNKIALPFNKRVEYLVDALFVFMPIIVVYYLTVPAVGFILHTDRSISYLDSLFTIEIIGHQWYWSYFLNCLESNYVFDLFFILLSENKLLSFLDQANVKLEFDQLMDNEAYVLTRCFEVNKHLVLPVNEYIRCFVTSEDVIHSWALPQVGVKVDALPGRIQSFILKSIKCGIFYGQCSELCGVNHAFMPIVVEFIEMESFFDWLLKETSLRFYKYLLNIWY
jgi:cytochrome c oxidase subunit 2